MSLARALLAAVCSCMALAAGVSQAQAVTAYEAIGFLNQQRAANGIPGDLAHDPYKTQGCDNHNRYMSLNVGMAHGEEPGEPGYTESGANPNGAEVLSRGDSTWSERSNPWITAPIHLYLMLDPGRIDAGYADSHGFACMRLGAGRAAPAAPEFFSYPGDGVTGVEPGESASELPYTPQQLVGIPQDATTGQNILLFSRGLGDVEAVGASLVGPEGAVDIRMVTESTQNAVGDGRWFRGGGVMIPVAPLRSWAPYQATIVWRTSSHGDVTQSIAFETRPEPNDMAIQHGVRRATERVTLVLETSAPNPALALEGPGGARLAPALKRVGMSHRTDALALPAGNWRACAQSGGREVGYLPAQACRSFEAFAPTHLAIGRRLSRGRVLITAGASAVGQRVQVTARRQRMNCSFAGGCVLRRVARMRRTLRLRETQYVRVLQRRRGEVLAVSVKLPAFVGPDGRHRATARGRSFRR